MKSRAIQPRLVSRIRLAFAVLPVSAGLFVSAQMLSSCAPGTVNCDDVGCGDSGGRGGSSSAGSGGSKAGSGGGGSGGSAGSGGASGGAGSGGTVTAETPVADCGSFGSKISEVEMNFFPMKCGTGKGSTCHGANAVWGDFTKIPLFSSTKAMAKKGINCPTEKLINTTDSSKSYILLKVSTDSPKCPDGTGDPTLRMPADETDSSKSGTPLSATELKCLTAYAKAVAGGN